MEKKANCEKAIMQAGLEKSKWENLILSESTERTYTSFTNRRGLQ